MMDTYINLSSEINQLHADICSALADPTRILALYLLSEHPYTVNELTEKLGVTQPSTSRHLKILRDRGLVQASRRGQAVEYSLRDRRLIDSLDTLRNVLKDSLAYRASLIEESV